MMKTKIAFIDSYVNIQYIRSLICENQSLGKVLSIRDGELYISDDIECITLTHATLCANIFLHNTRNSCELNFIQILDEKTNKTSVEKLVIALNWCLNNNIKIINMSIGTTLIRDLVPIFNIMDQLIKKDVLVIAASSNNFKMTYPATFHQIIGAKAIKNGSDKSEIYYSEQSLDRIEICCKIKNEIITYNQKRYMIYDSNSYAAPLVTAIVLDYVSEGIVNINQVRERLLHELKVLCNYNDDRIWSYIKRKIDIPVIAVINENREKNNFESSLSYNIQQNLTEKGYYGICLSDYNETSIEKYVLINLLDYKMLSIVKKIKFYSHYCDCAFIILNINKDLFMQNRLMKYSDVIISESYLNHRIQKKKYMCYQEYPNFNALFDELYHRLTK